MGLPLGRPFGVPVRLSMTWLLLAALVTFAYGQYVTSNRPGLPGPVAYAVGFGFLLCLLASVLLHELGHAMVSRQFGIGVRGITLETLGGYTEMDREPPRPSVELAVSLAGPAASLLVGVVFAVLAAAFPNGTLANEIAFQLAMGNLVVAAFNSLPGLPLDGGHALHAVIWAATGNSLRGQRIAGWAGRLLAVTGVAGAVALYSDGWIRTIVLVIVLVVAFTLWTGAGQAIRAASLAHLADRFDVAQLARPIVAVPPGTSLAQAWAEVTRSGLRDPVVAVADEYGQVVGLLHADAAAAVPAPRHPWITVDSLTRQVLPGHVIPAGLRGIELLRAVGRDPTADYLVLDGDDVTGVLRGADLTTLLESDGLVSRRTTR